jgi:hypothetical protein
MVPVLLGGMSGGGASARAGYVADILADVGVLGTADVPNAEAAVNRLGHGSPNPFNPATRIRYSLGSDTDRARLAVYDVAGRLVAVLSDGPAAAGEHEARWDGRDDSGRPVSSGVYFVRLSADGWSGSTKMTLLK